MRRRLYALGLLAVLVFPSISAAQYIPSSFDISGTWVLPGAGDRMRASTRSCYALDHALANHAMYGRDWIELRLVGAEYGALREGRDGFPEEHLVLTYVGTFHHHRGFGKSTAVTEINGSSVIDLIDVDYACALEEIDYALTGELRYSPERNWIYVVLEGTTSQTPSYQYETRVVLTGNSDDFEPSYDLFPLPMLEAMRLSPGWDQDTRAGSTELPGGCDFAGGHLGGIFSNCTLVRYAPLRFEPGDPPADIQPKGTIAGTLLEALPDGTPTNDPIPKAEISLYRQDQQVRERDPGESDASYAAYLVARTQARELIATAQPDPGGRFSFDQVPILHRDRSSRLQLRASYTLVVRKAEREEIGNGGENETVYFEVKSFHNLQPNRDELVYLKAFTGLGAKQELINNLSALSPNRYKPTEGLAQVQIDAWVNGLETLTPEAQEGLNRAIWAERVVQSGAQFAKENLEVTLDAFAALVTDLLVPKAFEKGKNLGKAEAVTDLAAAERKGFRQMLANPRESLADMKKSMLDEAKGRADEASIYDKIKGGVKSAIIAPVKLGLLELGMDGDTAAAVTDFVEKGLFSVLDIVFKRFLSKARDVGAYEESVKVLVEAAIKSLHGQIFESFNPSYCALTEPTLLMSVSEMDRWSTSNRSAYEADRGRAVGILSAMNDEASKVLAAAYWARTAAEGFGAAGDALETLGVVAKTPWVVFIEKLMKVMKHLSNATAFAAPLIETFGRLPDHVEQGANAAFGRQMARLVTTDPRLAEMGPFYSEPMDRFDAATYARWDATDRMKAAVREDRLGDAVLELAGPQPTSMRSLVATSLLALDHILLITQGGDLGWSSAFVRGGQLSERARARFELELERLGGELVALTLDVLLGAFESPADPEYLRRKAQLLSQIEMLEVSEGFVTPGGPELQNLFLPAVAVDVVELASLATGEKEVTVANERFRLRAKVRNLSTVPLDGLSLRLTVTASAGDVIVTGPPVQTVGSLAAGDATFGAGPDEVEKEWTLEYAAPLERGPGILLSLDVLRNGVEPRNVSTRPRGLILRLKDALLDADGDTLPDGWERVHSLDLGADDREADPDSDGLSNRRELSVGTRPDTSDTDGDGLSDGMELGVTAGVLSNPLLADSDGDGAPDSSDLAPMDPADGAGNSATGEPSVSVSASSVQLRLEQRLVSIDVTNGGGGTLRWTVVNENPHLIATAPRPGLEENEGGALTVSLPSWITPELTGYSTTIRLVDVWGQVPDSVEIRIEVPRATLGPDGGLVDGGPSLGDVSLSADVGAGADGSVSPDSGAPGPGPDPEPKAKEGGCGCKTTPARGASSELAAVVIALLALALRQLGSTRASRAHP